MFIRNFNPEDFNFVVDAWLKSYRTSPWAGVVTNDVYYSTYLHTIESLIKGGSTIDVVSDLEKLHGFICHSVTDDNKAVVHYIYNKMNVDNTELMLSRVFGSKPGFYTFKTKKITNYLPGWRYCPEIARRK